MPGTRTHWGGLSNYGMMTPSDLIRYHRSRFNPYPLYLILIDFENTMIGALFNNPVKLSIHSGQSQGFTPPANNSTVGLSLLLICDPPIHILAGAKQNVGPLSAVGEYLCDIFGLGVLLETGTRMAGDLGGEIPVPSIVPPIHKFEPFGRSKSFSEIDQGRADQYLRIREIKTERMAITTNNSTSVNPQWLFLLFCVTPKHLFHHHMAFVFLTDPLLIMEENPPVILSLTIMGDLLQHLIYMVNVILKRNAY